VTGVSNLLKIRPIAPVGDASAKANIERALKLDPVVSAYEVDVRMHNGTAYLYGNVDNEYERILAEDIAERQSGVISVVNHLEAEPWDYKSDFEIAEDIGGQLFWSPMVDRDDINVTVDNGTATLTGTVHSWSEHQAAIENAYEGGALSVRDELTTTYAPMDYTPTYRYSPYIPPVL
jgi:osmotically-inducible protein OsmY